MTPNTTKYILMTMINIFSYFHAPKFSEISYVNSPFNIKQQQSESTYPRPNSCMCLLKPNHVRSTRLLLGKCPPTHYNVVIMNFKRAF